MGSEQKVLTSAWGASLHEDGQIVGVRLKRTKAGLPIDRLVSINSSGWQTPFILGNVPLCAAVSSVISPVSEGSLFPASAISSEPSPDIEYHAWCHGADLDTWTDACSGSLTHVIPELYALGMSALQDPRSPASYLWAHFENNLLCAGVVDCGKAYAAQKIATSFEGAPAALIRFIRYARQGTIPESCFATLVWLGSQSSLPVFPAAFEGTVICSEIRFGARTLITRSELSALGAARVCAQNLPISRFALSPELPEFHSLRLALVAVVRWVTALSVLAVVLAALCWLFVSARAQKQLDTFTEYTTTLQKAQKASDSLLQALQKMQQAGDRNLRLTPHISALAQAMAPGITLDQIGTDPIAGSKSMKCTLAGTAADEAAVTRTLENLQKAKNIVQVNLSSMQARPKPSSGVSFIIVCVLQ